MVRLLFVVVVLACVVGIGVSGGYLLILVV